jgi:hypothetical protein
MSSQKSNNTKPVVVLKQPKLIPTPLALKRITTELGSSEKLADRRFVDLNKKRIEDFVKKPYTDPDYIINVNTNNNNKPFIAGTYNYNKINNQLDCISTSNVPEFQR